MKKMILMLFTLLWFGIANSQTTSNLYPDSVRCDGTNFTFYYPISQANSLNSVTELVLNVVGATTLDTLTVGNTTQNSTSYNIITNINGLSCSDVANSTTYYNNGWAYKDSCNTSTPLPVTLIEYTYKKVSENKIYLKWTTASELNNSHFELQKSYDGVTYFPLSKIKGSGTSNTINTYGIYDDIYRNNNYFRLIQYDFDGGVDTLGVVVVNYTPLILNLFNDANSVILTLTKPSNVKIYNSYGVLIEDFKFMDSGSFIINTYYYLTGTYFVEVNGETSETSKFRVY